MDDALHRERTRRDRSKITYRADVAELPVGAMVVLPEFNGTAALVNDGRLWLWSPGGYTPGPNLDSRVVDVLTPCSTIAVLSSGYRPVLHDSARA